MEKFRLEGYIAFIYCVILFLPIILYIVMHRNKCKHPIKYTL